MKTSLILLLLTMPFILLAKTYPILERDMLTEVDAYAKSDEFKSKVYEERNKKEKAIKEFSGVELAPAKDNMSYKVTDSYTLTQDIPRVDRDGNIIGILYKKGYTFNPLKYLPSAPPALIVFNACNPKEKRFVQDYIKNKNYYMLVSGGCELQKITGFDEMVYFVNDEMIQKFKLKNTISVVTVNLREAVYEIKVFANY